MTKIRVLIVDDERRSREILKGMLSDYCPDIEIVAMLGSASDARDFLNNNPIDLLFLDIAMPKESGFDFLSSLEKRNFLVIFVTAYNQYAINAIRANALDYILKPVDHELLIDAVNRSKLLLENKSELESGFNNSNQQINNFIDHIQSKKQSLECISIPFKNSFEQVKISNIIYIKASNNYSMIFLQDHREVLVAKTLKEYSKILKDEGFLRIHKSYLVNKLNIHQLSAAESLSLKVSNGEWLPISRRRHATIIKEVEC